MRTGPLPAPWGVTAPLGREAAGWGDMSQGSVHPLLVIGGARGTPALLLAPPHLAATPTCPGSFAVPSELPQLSPRQSRMARGCWPVVLGPQAKRGLEGEAGPRRGWRPLHLMAPHRPQGRGRPSPDWRMRLTSWPRSWPGRRQGAGGSRRCPGLRCPDGWVRLPPPFPAPASLSPAWFCCYNSPSFCSSHPGALRGRPGPQPEPPIHSWGSCAHAPHLLGLPRVIWAGAHVPLEVPGCTR